MHVYIAGWIYVYKYIHIKEKKSFKHILLRDNRLTLRDKFFNYIKQIILKYNITKPQNKKKIK